MEDAWAKMKKEDIKQPTYCKVGPVRLFIPSAVLSGIFQAEIDLPFRKGAHNVLTTSFTGKTDTARDWTNDRTPMDMQHPDLVPQSSPARDKKRSFKERSPEPEWELDIDLFRVGQPYADP